MQAAVEDDHLAFLEIFADEFGCVLPRDDGNPVHKIFAAGILASAVAGNGKRAHALAGRGLAHFGVADEAALDCNYIKHFLSFLSGDSSSRT